MHDVSCRLQITIVQIQDIYKEMSRIYHILHIYNLKKYSCIKWFRFCDKKPGATKYLMIVFL